MDGGYTFGEEPFVVAAVGQGVGAPPVLASLLEGAHIPPTVGVPDLSLPVPPAGLELAPVHVTILI
jgi:hypothetical protein